MTADSETPIFPKWKPPQRRNSRKVSPIPETHEEAKTISIDTTKQIFRRKDFIPKMSSLLGRLAKENPEFLFSNKIMLNSTETVYENSDGAALSYKGNQFMLSLAIKYKGSANIMDEFYGCEDDCFATKIKSAAT